MKYTAFCCILIFYMLVVHAEDSGYAITKKCTEPGLLCKSCDVLVDCISHGSIFDEIFVEQCPIGETCLKNRCTTEPNPACTKEETFQCTATGMFPDPLNCQLYHICVKNSEVQHYSGVKAVGEYSHFELKCMDGRGSPRAYAYDPITTYCPTLLRDNSCPINDFPVPICKTAGQSGPLKNRSMYYICVMDPDSLKLNPQLYLCENGKKFTNGSCV